MTNAVPELSLAPLKPGTERRLAAAFVAALVVLAAAMLLSTSVSRGQFDGEARIARRLAVLNGVENVLNVMIDAETGQRGYIITGREEYLEPYRLAVVRLDSVLARLDTLTRDDSVQHPRTHLLRRQANERMAIIHESIEARRNEGFNAAQVIILSNRGKRVMDELRQNVATMEVTENERLGERARRLAATARSSNLQFILAGLAIGLALAMFFIVARRGLVVRRHQADAIALERERLRVTLSSIGDAVIATDGEGRVMFLNPVAANLIGWSQDEALGRPLSEVFRIINEQTRQPLANPAMVAMHRSAVVSLTNHTLLVARDGSEIAIDDSAAPICDRQRTTVGAVLVFRAVAERRRAERERRALLKAEREARAAAEAASAAKDDFLAVVSHELRTPVTSLRLQVRILARAIEEALRAPGAPTEALGRIRGHTEVLDADSRRLGDLIERLLDVTRIASGQFDLQPGPARLGDIIRSAVAALPHERSGDPPITIALEGNLSGSWDARRLEQVVVNLVSNALRYADGQQVVVRGRANGKEVVLEVQDQGPGMTPQQQAQLFQRFGRASAESGGLGLGLYISRRIITGHGGDIDVSSEPGGGTTFTVRLPRIIPEAPPPAPA